MFKLGFTRRLASHLFFWFIVVSVFGTTASYDPKDPYTRLAVVLYDFLVILIVVYHNLYFLFPQFLNLNRYVIYFSAIVAEILLGAFLIHYFVPRIFNEPSHYIQGLFLIGFFVLFTSGIKLMRDGVRNQFSLEESRSKQLQAEINLLKSQVNPHFLFNTLNNLYSLTLAKSDDAPIMVLKLSAFMRYLLESSKTEITTLRRECHFIEDYLDLERLRLSQKADIQ